jgi:SdrD B-like domain
MVISFVSKLFSVASVTALVFGFLVALNQPAIQVAANFHSNDPVGRLSCAAPVVDDTTVSSSITPTDIIDPDSVSPEKITKLITIGDTVYLDLNRNGIQNIGEPALPGAVVILYGNSGAGVYPVASQVTGANGKYLFEEVGVGEHNYNVLVINFDQVIHSNPAFAMYDGIHFYPSTNYPTYDDPELEPTTTYKGAAVQWVNAVSPDFTDSDLRYDFGFAPCTDPVVSSSSSSSSSSSVSSSVSSSTSSSNSSSSSSVISSSSSVSSSSSSQSSSSSVLSFSSSSTPAQVCITLGQLNPLNLPLCPIEKVLDFSVSSQSSIAKVLASTGINTTQMFGFGFLFAGIAVYSYKYRRQNLR